jgi:signal transduction histidine kinase
MEAVRQLTGGIAHDFNNLLMVILANADERQDERNPDAAMVAARLEPITQAVLRASALTGQLLAFSRTQPLSPKHTDLNELVGETGELLRRALGAHIEIESALADDLWTVISTGPNSRPPSLISASMHATPCPVAASC